MDSILLKFKSLRLTGKKPPTYIWDALAESRNLAGVLKLSYNRKSPILTRIPHEFCNKNATIMAC